MVCYLASTITLITYHRSKLSQLTFQAWLGIFFAMLVLGLRMFSAILEYSTTTKTTKDPNALTEAG